MKRFFALTATLLMLLSFAACSEGGNVDDSQSGGVVSDVKSDVESTMSKVGSDVDSMMSK